MAYTTINKSTDFFNTKLYTGTGSSNSITGINFRPDFTWIKSRSNTYSHTLTDAVRGVTKHSSTNNTNAEYTSTTEITSFDSDGFTVGTDAGVNNSGSTFVSWNWKANGQGSANSDGTITTTYTSANSTSGVSISTYTGTGSSGTIGHGLGVAPKMVIVKSLSSTTWWMCYHASLGNDKEFYLNSTNPASSSITWNSTTPTSSVISLNPAGGSGVNVSGVNYVCYSFAEVLGFSKISSYIGNGSSDAPFLNCGFKPSFVMIKGIDSGGSDNWNIIDSKRLGYNGNNNRLFANSNAVENTTSIADILSTGFKLRVSSTDVNASDKTYIFMAFAEAPLVGSNNVPCTAR